MAGNPMEQTNVQYVQGKRILAIIPISKDPGPK